MENIFEREGQNDTLHTMDIKVKISEKDHRMCFKLDNKTCINILKPVGDTASIYNCIGKGSFGAALASSISIGCAVTEHLQAKTLDKREAGLKDILDEKMYLAENTSLKGMNTAMAAIIQSKSQVVC